MSEHKPSTGQALVDLSLEINASWFRNCIITGIVAGVIGFGAGQLSSARNQTNVQALNVQKVESWSDGQYSKLYQATAYQSFDGAPFVKIESNTNSNLIFVTQKGVQNFYLNPGGSIYVPKYES